MVHIFLEEARKFYDLEGLWGDALVQEVSDNGKVKKTVKKAGLKTRKRKLM
ncbi:MAG TPA: RsfS/YbeB/iojap family protein [candidate division Zixibacteria bacterium]|nr:RsfS/YbeB/iojap family protein [candidate division Zixibacteria bacterium]